MHIVLIQEPKQEVSIVQHYCRLTNALEKATKWSTSEAKSSKMQFITITSSTSSLLVHDMKYQSENRMNEKLATSSVNVVKLLFSLSKSTIEFDFLYSPCDGALNLENT